MRNRQYNRNNTGYLVLPVSSIRGGRISLKLSSEVLTQPAREKNGEQLTYRIRHC